MNLSWAFIKRHVAAVLIALLACAGAWKYLDTKKDAFEKDVSARLDALREREVDLAKDRAAFAESLAVLRLERIQIAEDRAQLVQLKQELEDKTQLLRREGRQLEDKEKLIARKVRLDRNMQLYAEQYAALTSADDSKACDSGRDDKIAGGQSLLRLIKVDADALQDRNVQDFVSSEFSHKYRWVTFCPKDRIRQGDGVR
jgi:hypothetical protein